MSTIASKVSPICKLIDVIDKSAVNGNLLVASSSTTSHDSLVYPANDFNNSDRVRQAFAKRVGIKFTDARCSKMKSLAVKKK